MPNRINHRYHYTPPPGELRIRNRELRIGNWRVRIVPPPPQNEKPPFRKRGVGGIYTYIYTYTYAYAYTPPGTTTNLASAMNAAADGAWAGDAARYSAPRGNPPNPLLRKGGFSVGG